MAQPCLQPTGLNLSITAPSSLPAIAVPYLRKVQEAHECLHVGQLNPLRECCDVQALRIGALILQEALPQLHLLKLVVTTLACRANQ